MKTFQVLVTVALMAFTVPSLAAVESPTSEKEQEKLRAEMREARRDMEKAARRLAELSRQLGQDRGFAFEMAGDGEAPLRHFMLSKRPGHAMLGVMVGNRGERAEGVEVLSVTPGGPADRAGIQTGDVIVAIEDTDLKGEKGAEELVRMLRNLKPGSEVEVAYRRGNDTRTAKVVSEEFEHRFRFLTPPALDAAMPFAPHAPRFLDLLHRWGDIELAPVSTQLGEYFGTDKGLLVVRAPRKDSLKLQDGDVILAIGGREPEDSAHAMRILGSYRPGEKVTLDIMRKRKKQSLDIEIPERQVTLRHTPRVRSEAIARAVPR